MVVFECPVGAVADVKELEYVSALHQTAPVVRRDGSIDANDIKVYLRSRFGIEVTPREVCDTILQGMGGGNDDAQVLDLMEVVAILLIPVLRKAARLQHGYPSPSKTTAESTSVPHEGLIQHVLDMILFDVVGQEQDMDSKYIQKEDGADNDGIFRPPQLTIQLLQKIFRAYGEEELATDEDLLQSMLDHVVSAVSSSSSPSSSSTLVLDANTFAVALTKDVLLFDIDRETAPSNAYMDVFEDNPTLEDTPDGGENNNNNNSSPVQHIFTAPAIDSTAATYRSKTLLVSLWAGTLFTYFAFIRPSIPTPGDADCGDYLVGGTWGENAGIMACETTGSILVWIFLFTNLCFFGMIFVGCGSVGNADNTKRFWAPLFGLVCILGTVAVPESSFQGDTEPTIDDNPDDGDEAGIVYIKVVALILLCIVAVLHVLHLVFLCAPEESKIKDILGNHAMQDEIDLKIAQGYKLNNMVSNALKIHGRRNKSSVLRTCFGHGIYEYSKSTERDVIKTGGFLWGWKLIWTKDAFRKEGIWFSARMIASNISQYVVWLYILLTGTYLLGYVRDNFDEEAARQSMKDTLGKFLDKSINAEDVYGFSAELSGVVGGFLSSLQSSNAIDLNCSGVFGSGWDAVSQICTGFLECNKNVTSESVCALIDLQNSGDVDGYTQMSLLDASGLDANVLLDQVRRSMESAVDSTVDSLYPEEEYMITIPFVVGIVTALLASASLALGYLPSVTATYIQLRTGVIPTLTDDLLHRYREAPDTVTLLTGSLFWGCLFASILVGVIAGLVVFVFIWQGSVYFAQQFVAIFIGILIVTLIRVGIFCIGRSRYFRAFYRTKPAAANIFFLAMEWANFALSAGFIFVRMIKLLLVTSLSLGRIDSRFLAKGVGEIGPLEFDAFPTIHLRDILSHEAHRHPYISVLGTMYLMKLRYQKDFGTTAGSCWRLIFVYALMPWLQKYRILEDMSKHKTRSKGSSPDDETFQGSGLVQKLSRLAPSRNEKDEIIVKMEKEINRLRVELERAMVQNPK